MKNFYSICKDLYAGLMLIFFLSHCSVTSIQDTVAMPTFTPDPGSYSSKQTITISTTTEGASIYYDLISQNSVAFQQVSYLPDAPVVTCSGSGKLYTGSISVTESSMIRAIACKDGWNDSEIASNSYMFTWASHSSGVSTVLSGVAFSGTKYVAVGWNGTLITSLDGETWSNGNPGIASDINAIIWSGTQFVAVGGWGEILTSPDGITWTSRGSYATTNWNLFNAIVWNGTKYVAVCAGGEIYTSNDAITWTLQASGTTGWFDAITWSGTQFVAAGWAGIIYTSPDGITWTQRNSGVTDDIYGIAYGNNLYVAVGMYQNGINGGMVLTSPDGINWTLQSPPASSSSGVDDLDAITWNGSEFVAVGGSGTIIKSSDGVTWVNRDSGVNQTIFGILWDGARYIAVGDSYFVGTIGESVILTSP